MKIFDRYIIVNYLKNYLLSFAVLIGLYVVLDMIFNFDDVVNIKAIRSGGVSSLIATFSAIGNFYFYQSLLIFVHLSAIIPIVAAAFTLIKLARFNEMTAMLAAGVPLLRIAMPIILVATVLNALLLVDQEWIIPGVIPKLLREHEDLNRSSPRSFSIKGMAINGNARLCAGEYTPPADNTPAGIRVFDVVELDANLRPSGQVLADSAVWDEKNNQWVLQNGIRRSLISTGRVIPEQAIAAYPCSATPEEIGVYRGGHFAQLLSSKRINQLLQREGYRTPDLARIKHTRFTQPLANLIVLLLAISAVLSRDPSNLKTSAVRCVGITGLGLGVVFFFYYLAGMSPGGPAWLDRWAALMAWMPIFILGPLAVWLLDRVET